MSDPEPFGVPRDDWRLADVQVTRLLHAETQRQLVRLTEVVTGLETRLRELETQRNYREGQVSVSTGLGGMAFKIGLVVLAFSLGVWGSQVFPPPPYDRQREPHTPTYMHEPYLRRPLEDLDDGEGE